MKVSKKKDVYTELVKDINTIHIADTRSLV